MPVGMVACLIVFGASVGRAQTLLLEMHTRGPLQSEAGTFAGDSGFESLVSARFTLPGPVRIDSIRAGIKGPGVGWIAISPLVWDNTEPEFYRSIPLEQPDDSPAEWQEFDSLDWSLGAGEYNLFLDAPHIPYGRGFGDPTLTPEFSVYDLLDYSTLPPIEAQPFGLQVYGEVYHPISGTPEPSTFGLMGVVVLLAVVAHRLKGFPDRRE